MTKQILFNTNMVKAILEGRKRVTRRVIKPTQMQGIAPDRCPNHTPEEFVKEKPLLFEPYCDMSDEDMIKAIFKSPYQKDDILYVRETWAYISDWIAIDPDVGVFDGFIYKADWDNNAKKSERPEWKPSIHMPKEAARIFLRVTNVSVARLQDMTEDDVAKEGVPGDIDYPISSIYCPYCKGEGLVGTLHSGTLGYMEVECNHCDTRIKRFKNLWDFTIKQDIDKYGWSANPWVWVIEFERTEKPNEWV